MISRRLFFGDLFFTVGGFCGLNSVAIGFGPKIHSPTVECFSYNGVIFEHKDIISVSIQPKGIYESAKRRCIQAVIDISAICDCSDPHKLRELLLRPRGKLRLLINDMTKVDSGHSVDLMSGPHPQFCIITKNRNKTSSFFVEYRVVTNY